MRRHERETANENGDSSYTGPVVGLSVPLPLRGEG
jgi:hypothetical protein